MFSEPSSPTESGRHFMSLTDGFPIPKYKTGALQQILGYNFDGYRYIDKETIRGVSRSQDDAYCTTVHASNTKANNSEIYSFEKPTGIVVQPQNVGLIPASEWTIRPVTLEMMRNSYFTKRNGAARSFDVKLYNALRITKDNPNAYKYIGVMWIDDSHFKINEKVYENFIGVKANHITLFDKQGAISKYGFKQIYKSMNPRFRFNAQCDDVDDNEIRIFTDPMRRFSRDQPFNRVYL